MNGFTSLFSTLIDAPMNENARGEDDRFSPFSGSFFPWDRSVQ